MDPYDVFPESKFRPLHEVLVAVYATRPTIHCAFMENDDSPCRNTVESRDSEVVKDWIEKISQCLIMSKKNSPLDNFLFQLAHYCLCDHHAGMAKEGLRYQWVRDFENRYLVAEFTSLLTANFRWPPPPRKLEFIAHRPNCASSKGVETRLEKYKRIDKLLEKALSQPDKNYVYVISSPEAPGKLKIGVSGTHPDEQRVIQHSKCYPDSKRIKVWSVTRFAYRVEQLILAQFEEKHFKLHEKCWVCLTSHQEWIEVDEKTLFDRIDEWDEFFIDRAHKIKSIYDKDGKFNPAAGRHSPHRKESPKCDDISPNTVGKLNWKARGNRGKSPEILKNSTPVKKSGRSRSVTAVEDSPAKDIDTSDSDSPGTPAEETPTKKGRRLSSRRGALLNDSRVPSSKIRIYATRSRGSSMDPDAVLNESMRKMGLADWTAQPMEEPVHEKLCTLM
ncbi:hypothetical protein N7466_000926 [Penicillium verhagenii]|uniref:uncharacterized protein n=1 Tax=Penicillium verhagenii TaxID=1562060 RepID=UPI002544E5B9|nr:uncharacterized protein N7466_000926 [Penicillium verhagenii]KAJ5947911.1 hypothetical protein N7466_000926 [Penicillium verhagenii]